MSGNKFPQIAKKVLIPSIFLFVLLSGLLVSLTSSLVGVNLTNFKQVPILLGSDDQVASNFILFLEKQDIESVGGLLCQKDYYTPTKESLESLMNEINSKPEYKVSHSLNNIRNNTSPSLSYTQDIEIRFEKGANSYKSNKQYILVRSKDWLRLSCISELFG